MAKSIVDLGKELEALDRAKNEYLADYHHKRSLIVADIIEQAGETDGTPAPGRNGSHPSPSPPPQPPEEGKKRGKKGGGPREGPTTKQHILSLLRRSRNGLALRGLVAEMTRLKESGEWKTESDSVTSVVSQAMNGLKKDKLVVVEKDAETNRNVYSIVAPQTAATT